MPTAVSESSPRSRWLAPAAWLAVLLTAGALVAAPVPTSPAPARASGTTTPATLAAESSGASARDCSHCHHFDDTLSHPTGVKPKATLPAEFPLEDGKLACTSCHTVVPHSERGQGPMLRVQAGPTFCAQCHRQGQKRLNPHTGGNVKAHLTRSNRSTSSTRAFGLDGETQACMACHDGAASMDSGTHRSQSFGSNTDHPVGVEYRPKLSSNIQLNDPLRLDKRIRLFDRAVGCGSCHSIYSKQSKLLVMPNVRSQLCLSCHIE